MQATREVERSQAIRPAGFPAPGNSLVFHARLAGRGAAREAEGGEVWQRAEGAEEVEDLEGFADEGEVEVFEGFAF